MILVKIQCDCGQFYAFGIDPVNGGLSTPVVCPVCGTDGSTTANEVIAQGFPMVSTMRATGFMRTAAPPGAKRSENRSRSWATEQSQINKLGTWLTVGPAVLATFISCGIIGVEIPATNLESILWLMAGIGGLLGGALNVAGRGPVLAGGLVGLLIATGGYGGVCWWLHDHWSIRGFEPVLAFAGGAAPGWLFQLVLLKVMRKRALATFSSSRTETP